MTGEAAFTVASWVPAMLGALGTIVAASLAAILTMQYWKRQRFLQQQHEIAYSTIHKAILLRDEFWRARSFVMTGAEIEEIKKRYDITDEHVQTIEEKCDDPFARIGHLGRFWDLQKRYTELHIQSIELEALLGDEYRDLLKPIDNLVRKFYNSIQLYIDQDYNNEIDGKSRWELKRVVYGDRSVGDDLFGGEVESAVKALVDDLRRYLVSK